MPAVGVATAVIVTLLIDADWPCADEPLARLTVQLVAAYAAAPAISVPITPETTFARRDQRLGRDMR